MRILALIGTLILATVVATPVLAQGKHSSPSYEEDNGNLPSGKDDVGSCLEKIGLTYKRDFRFRKDGGLSIRDGATRQVSASALENCGVYKRERD